MSSISDFEKSFERATKIVTTKSENAITSAVVNTLANIITDTPVDTGQLRGNWQTTLGSPSNISLEGLTDPSGVGTVAKSKRALKKFKLSSGEDIFMTNNLNYATRIEFGHYSSQAPQGMVRINLAKFKEILESEVKKR